jgi:hypothetical protein
VCLPAARIPARLQAQLLPPVGMGCVCPAALHPLSPGYYVAYCHCCSAFARRHGGVGRVAVSVGVRGGGGGRPAHVCSAAHTTLHPLPPLCVLSSRPAPAALAARRRRGAHACSFAAVPPVTRLDCSHAGVGAAGCSTVTTRGCRVRDGGLRAGVGSSGVTWLAGLWRALADFPALRCGSHCWCCGLRGARAALCSPPRHGRWWSGRSRTGRSRSCPVTGPATASQ